MPETLQKPRLRTKNQKLKINPELNNNIIKSNLPPEKQIYRKKILSGNGFLIYK